MARYSGFHMADRALGGKLGPLLLEWDADENVSLFEMAYRLRSEHDLRISPKTVSRWIEVARAADTEAAS